MPYDIPSYSTRAPETAEQLLREATDRALAEQNGVQRQPRQRAVRPPGGAERLIQEMVEPAPPRDPDAVERVQTALAWWQDSQRKLSEQRSQRAAIQGEGSERLPSRTPVVDVPTMRGPQAGMWVGGNAPEEFPRDRIEGFTATTGTTPPTAPGSIYRPGAHGMDVNIPPRSFDPPTPTHGKSPNEVVELLRKYGGGTGQPSRQAIPPGSPGERQQAHMLDIVDAARSTTDLGQALMSSGQQREWQEARMFPTPDLMEPTRMAGGARQPSQRELGLRAEHRARLAKTRATRRAGVRRKGAVRSWQRIGANPMQAMAMSGGMGGGGGMDNPLMMAMMGVPPSVTTAMVQGKQRQQALAEHGRQFDVTSKLDAEMRPREVGIREILAAGQLERDRAASDESRLRGETIRFGMSPEGQKRQERGTLLGALSPEAAEGRLHKVEGTGTQQGDVTPLAPLPEPRGPVESTRDTSGEWRARGVRALQRIKAVDPTGARAIEQAADDAAMVRAIRVQVGRGTVSEAEGNAMVATLKGTDRAHLGSPGGEWKVWTLNPYLRGMGLKETPAGWSNNVLPW